MGRGQGRVKMRQGVSMASGSLSATLEKRNGQLSPLSLPLCLALLSQHNLRAAEGHGCSSPYLLRSHSSHALVLPVLVLNPPPVDLGAVQQVVLLIALQCELLGVIGLVVVQGNNHGFFRLRK